MRRIRAVTLDLWGTLISDIHSVDERRTLRSEIISRHLRDGGSTTLDAIEEAQTAAWSWFQGIHEADWRTPKPAEILVHILELLGEDPEEVAFDDLAAEFQDVSLRFPPDPLPGAVDAVKRLASRVPLAVISDTGFTPGSVIREIFKEIGFDGTFRAMTFSDEQDRSKPHPSAFLRTLDELGAEPAEALHIGDTERTDIIGSRTVGMMSILYARGGEVVPGTVADGVLADWSALGPLFEETGIVLEGP